jgi:hypothetical protein
VAKRGDCVGGARRWFSVGDGGYGVVEVRVLGF